MFTFLYLMVMMEGVQHTDSWSTQGAITDNVGIRCHNRKASNIISMNPIELVYLRCLPAENFSALDGKLRA